MDELRKLVGEVRFRERFRGYDYDEVDAYVSSVSNAAVKTDAHVAEIQQRMERAEAEVAELISEQHQSEGEEFGNKQLQERLARVLILAQRTADEVEERAEAQAEMLMDEARKQAEKVVSEAEMSAESRLREAEKQSVLVMADAKSRAELIINDAKDTASQEAATARSSAMREVSVLTKAKADLVREIVALESQCGDHRRQLRLLWRSLCLFVAEIGLDGEVEESSQSIVEVLSDGNGAEIHESVEKSVDSTSVDSTAGVSISLGVTESVSDDGVAADAHGSAMAHKVAEPVVDAKRSARKLDDERAVSKPVSEPLTAEQPMPGWRDSPIESAPVGLEAHVGNNPPALHSSGRASYVNKGNTASTSQPGVSKTTLPDSASDHHNGNEASPSAVSDRCTNESLEHFTDVETSAVSTSRARPMRLTALANTGSSDIRAEDFSGHDDQASSDLNHGDEQDIKGEFVEQLRRVVNGYGPPLEASQVSYEVDDPMAAFFDNDEPLARRRWRRARR